VDTGTSRFDLSLLQDQRPHGLLGCLTYNTDLFDPETVQRMAGHWSMLLAGIVADPGGRISELPLLTASEQHRILVDWNRSPLASPVPTCIHSLIEEQARTHPDALAVVHGDRQLSYERLDRRAGRLAARLRAEGVGPESLVGVFLERSPEMVIAVLAVLKAGGAYVPLDPAYPARRIAFVLEDAGVGVLITKRSLLGRLPRTEAIALCADEEDGGGSLAVDAEQ
jgi:non-ribosomal peptide synthetase component F